MKKLTLTILTLCFGLIASAQSFEGVINNSDDIHENTIYNSIELPSNEYVIGVTLTDTISETISSKLYVINQNGYRVDSILLPYSVYNLLYKDGSIYFTATNQKVDSNFKYINGDSLIVGEVDPLTFQLKKIKKHHMSMDYLSRDFKYFNSCECFTISGVVTSDTIVNAKGFILQMDTSLNIIRNQIIESVFSVRVRGVIESPDGKGYLALLTNSLIHYQTFRGFANVIPLNNRLEWDSTTVYFLDTKEKQPPEAGGNIIIEDHPSIIKLTDTTYMVSGQTLMYRRGNTGRPANTFITYIITDTGLNDSSLNLLNYGFLGAIDSSNFASVGYAMASTENYVYVIFKNYYFKYVIGLSKLDKNGNLIWQRYYSYNGAALYPRNVLTTSDGGVFITADYHEFNKPKPSTCYMKILDRDTITSLPTSDKIEAINYHIYPNPAREELSLMKLNNFVRYDFELYDAFGRKVKEVPWTENLQQMDVSHLARGVYIYRIIDQSGRVASGKVIIE